MSREDFPSKSNFSGLKSEVFWTFPKNVNYGLPAQKRDERYEKVYVIIIYAKP